MLIILFFLAVVLVFVYAVDRKLRHYIHEPLSTKMLVLPWVLVIVSALAGYATFHIGNLIIGMSLLLPSLFIAVCSVSMSVRICFRRTLYVVPAILSLVLSVCLMVAIIFRLLFVNASV